MACTTAKISAITLTLLLPSCSWLGLEGNKDAYLKAGSTDRTEIPGELDRPPFIDLMPIPVVEDARGIAGQEFELELPEPLSTTFGVDQIVIRKLGESRWVFLDASPATVWPKVETFWLTKNMQLVTTDPGRGIMETEWVSSSEGDAEAVYESMTSPRKFGARNTRKNKFQLRLEPGVRTGSTELFITQRNISVSRAEPSRVDWTDFSDDAELEGKVLTELAYYLGETINDNSQVSLLAASLQEDRTTLIPDRTRPLLKYKLDFNRAWATVGSALESARIEVEDLDRTRNLYFVYYPDETVDEPGMLRKLFSRKGKKGKNTEEERALQAQMEGHRYQVMVQQVDDQIEVSVYKAGDVLADAIVAERLLKIIREFST